MCAMIFGKKDSGFKPRNSSYPSMKQGKQRTQRGKLNFIKFSFFQLLNIKYPLKKSVLLFLRFITHSPSSYYLSLLNIRMEQNVFFYS